MDITVYEQDGKFVIENFKNGKFDYIEGVKEITEEKYFKYLFGEGVILKLAETYPTPRKKEQVPLWLYVASNMSLKFRGWQGNYSFNSYPYVIRCGGLINALSKEIAQKRKDENGNIVLECNGFNNKNHYPRQTPCDQDYLRKLSRDTEPEKLQNWYNKDVVNCLKDKEVFDEEGIFIGDSCYIFVPDNPEYENSSLLLFDENDHPVNPEKIDPNKKGKYTWRRCYKLITLVHTNRKKEYYLYVGIIVVSGADHECPILYKMVKNFVEIHGKGIMKLLIIDRGLIDGKSIEKCKKELDVDVIIPPRQNMEILEDAKGIRRLEEVEWFEIKEISEQEILKKIKPEAILKREQKRQEKLRLKEKGKKLIKKLCGGIKGFTSWEGCDLELNVVVNKQIYEDGTENEWYLVTTMNFEDPRKITKYYNLRPLIEERHRQLKCFWGINKFTSRKFSLVVNQIIFILLVYTFLQVYLLNLSRTELNNMTIPRLQEELSSVESYVIIYYKQRFTYLYNIEHQELLLTLSKESAKKILNKTRRIRRKYYPFLKPP